MDPNNQQTVVEAVESFLRERNHLRTALRETTDPDHPEWVEVFMDRLRAVYSAEDYRILCAYLRDPIRLTRFHERIQARQEAASAEREGDQQ